MSVMRVLRNRVLCVVLSFLLAGGAAIAQVEAVAASGEEFEVEWNSVNYALEHSDVTYKTVDGLDLTLDILARKNSVGDSPVLVYVHGGDWNKGNKSYVHRPLVEDLFQQFIDEGFRVVSIDYRLCRPHTPVPMAISDAKDAVRWVKKHSANYGFDTSKILMMGTSAGGHISMMAAYSNDDKYKGDAGLVDYSSAVNGLVNCYGPVDVLKPFHYRTGITIQLGRWLFNKSLYKTFLTTSYDFAGLKYPKQSKELREFMIEHSITSIEVPRNVPTLTLHGLADKVVQPSNAKILDKYLEKNNIPSTVELYKGVKHSFVKATPQQMQQMCDAVKLFSK